MARSLGWTRATVAGRNHARPAPPGRDRTLLTPGGPVAQPEYRLRAAGRQRTILHTEARFTVADETRSFRGSRERLPYGVALCPAAIALTHDLAAWPEVVRVRRVLELGAGTGLSGIVVALGSQEVQTDRHDLALSLCRHTGERNGARSIVYRPADWTDWDDDGLPWPRTPSAVLAV